LEEFVVFLAAGNYVACGQSTTQGLLDPCHWALAAPTFTITGGQTTAGVNVVMAAGAVVPIHVNDPNRLLAPAAAAIEMDCRFQMVTPQGRRYEAIIVGHSSVSRDYQITIPFGMALSLRALCPHLVVNDASGAPVAAAGVSVTVPQPVPSTQSIISASPVSSPGANIPPFIYAVIGAQP
jgi:hypothetical protein